MGWANQGMARTYINKSARMQLNSGKRIFGQLNESTPNNVTHSSHLPSTSYGAPSGTATPRLSRLSLHRKRSAPATITSGKYINWIKKPFLSLERYPFKQSKEQILLYFRSKF